MKFTFLILVSIIFSSAANAQAALIALIFGDKVATENFHMSVDLGLNISSMPGLEKQKSVHGFYFGLGTFIKLNEKWALTPEFKPLSPRGAKNVLPLKDYSSTISDPSYKIALNYIDVPILAQYKIKPKLFVSAGPQVSFLTSAKQLAEGKLSSGSTVNIEEKMKSNFKSVYFSLPLEVGYTLSSARKGKGADLKIRYNIGLSEMIDNAAYGSSKGSTFQVFLSFPFIADEK